MSPPVLNDNANTRWSINNVVDTLSLIDRLAGTVSKRAVHGTDNQYHEPGNHNGQGTIYAIMFAFVGLPMLLLALWTLDCFIYACKWYHRDETPFWSEFVRTMVCRPTMPRTTICGWRGGFFMYGSEHCERLGERWASCTTGFRDCMSSVIHPFTKNHESSRENSNSNDSIVASTESNNCGNNDDAQPARKKPLHIDRYESHM